MIENITEARLSQIRATLEAGMSPKRYRHTAEVEKMAVRLGELFAPQKINVLRASALLHDITKEWTSEEHIAFFADRGIELSKAELLAPKTYHARSAALLISERYGDVATDEVVSAVRWHTTGRVGMTLTEKLIYLADYIDMSRTFPDCVRLRDYFFSAEPEKMSKSERLVHLDKTLILSFDMTIKALIDDGAVVSDETFAARNDLIVRLS